MGYENLILKCQENYIKSLQNQPDAQFSLNSNIIAGSRWFDDISNVCRIIDDDISHPKPSLTWAIRRCYLCFETTLDPRANIQNKCIYCLIVGTFT